jgi:leucyl-tRNA synthetase
MDAERVRHWQEAWTRAAIAIGRRVPAHGKFFALVAYPGTSGFFHVGHLRGYAYTDTLHRYHRMRGEEVLFPFGVHASGLPAVTWAQKVKNRDPTTVRQLELEHVPSSEWSRLEEPEAAARFLGESYRRVLRALGVLVDETTYVTTIDADYSAFIRWQFHALREAGGLVQGTYYAPVCPVCGPVAVDPSETDLSSGGEAEVVRFTTVPFALEDGRVLLAATLRPETVYGVTNLWLAPGGTLVLWHRGASAYLVARKGAERLVEQHGGHIGHEVPVASLVGRKVRVPLREVSVPVLLSPLVDPAVGTGVVMSVPAHAPADAVAIAELDPASRAEIGVPPVLLEVPQDAGLTPSEHELLNGSGTLAERALHALGVKGLKDAERLNEATERVYRLEFVRGRMTVPPLVGIRVRDAREKVAQILKEAGPSFDLQEFSIPVICRNGHEVVIRRVPDQWFLHYGDPEWKSATTAVARELVTYPTDYRRELLGIIDWYADRPCIRKGRWLGTPFPFDPEWTIEPIADSTLYMAYFIVRRFVTAGRLRAEQLTNAFFEFVFRGRGPGEPTVARALQEEVRSEFLYWYPLDFNVSGKEHKRVHFPAFLFTHAKLLPPELAPKGIYVHHWVTGPAGDKISKKEVGAKGGRIPSIEGALASWGPDAIRLYHLIAASPEQDMEWDPDLVDNAAERLQEVERLVRGSRGDSASLPGLEAWLDSRMHRLIGEVRSAYDRGELRTAAELTCVGAPALLRRFYARGGAPGNASDRVGRAWIRLLSPIAPHLAEELGEGRFPGLVAVEAFPTPEEFPRSEVAEAREAFLERVEEDLRAVLKPASVRGEPAPQEVVFYVAEPWKAHVEQWMRESIQRGETPTVRDLVERAAGVPEVDAHRGELAKHVQRVLPLLRSEPGPQEASVDELEVLRASEGYLSRRFGFSSVSVLRESEAASADPLGRRERARPGRPAFYLVRPASRTDSS